MLTTEEETNKQELSSLHQKTSNIGNKIWTGLKWSGIFVIGIVSAATAAYTLSQGLALLNIISGPISSALLMNIIGYVFAAAIIGVVATGLVYGGYKIYQKYKKKNKKYEKNPKKEEKINPVETVKNIQPLPAPITKQSNENLEKESVKQKSNEDLEKAEKNSNINIHDQQEHLQHSINQNNKFGTNNIHEVQQEIKK